MKIFLTALAGAVVAYGSPGELVSQALEDTRILAADEMQGRAAASPGGERARRYIIQRFQEIGVDPVFGDGFEQPFRFSARRTPEGSGVNLVARIDGGEASSRSILVMAHYDHEGVVDGEIYNGADDNASGVAGLLAVASAMKAAAPRHTIYIVATDAEESGLNGARYLSGNMPGGLQNIAVVVNFDMLSKNADNEIYASGATHAPHLRPILEGVAADAPVRLLLGHDTPEPTRGDDWTFQSDHYPFHQQGVPWIYLGVENHDEYHTPQDDFETIPQEFFSGVIETAISIVRAFDEEL